MNCTEHKYQKYIEIASATMCPNNDPDIELPHWKFVYHCYKNLPSLYLPA